jgi:hypothetical protein
MTPAAGEPHTGRVQDVPVLDVLCDDRDHERTDSRADDAAQEKEPHVLSCPCGGIHGL